jgi:uncharacterized protein involved in exopolysaccharide biosynthesis
MELRTFLAVLWRRKWVFGISYLLFFGSVVAWAFLATKIWDGTAKVMLIESSTALSTFTQSLGIATSGTPVGAGTTSKNYDTEIALATIGESLDKLISDIQLTGRNGKPLTRKKLVPSSPLSKIAYKLRPQPYLEVSQLENSDLLTITSYSTSSVQAARMSNELAKLFVQNRIKTVRSEFQSVRVFLNRNIGSIERRYKRSAAAKRDMLVADNTVDIASEEKSLLDYIATMEKKMNDLSADIAGKTADLTPAHPDIVALKRKVEITREILNQKTQADRSGYPTKRMKQAETDLVLGVYSNLYGKLLDYSTKLDIAESLTLSKISVVEPAIPQEDPAFPNKPLSLILGMVLGFCLALAFVLIVESLDNTVNHPDHDDNQADLEESSGRP